jgi:hypothetical protein
MHPPIPPKPPEHVLVLLHSIARRWDSRTEAVETVLRANNIEIVDVPQRPRKGCRLSDLMVFEAAWRLSMQQEREAQLEARKDSIEPGRRRKEAAGERIAEALTQEGSTR